MKNNILSSIAHFIESLKTYESNGPPYSGPVSAVCKLHQSALLEMCCKVLCESASRRHAGGKARAFRLMQSLIVGKSDAGGGVGDVMMKSLAQVKLINCSCWSLLGGKGPNVPLPLTS